MSGDVVGWVPADDLSEMSWSEQPREPRTRSCPRTWPHPAHNGWHTGDIVRPFDAVRATFDCPGIPVTTNSGKTVTL